jgi:hypothetical protein
LLGKRTFEAIVFSTMSLASAAAAIKAFLRQLDMAQDMAAAGALGSVFNSVLSDADNLLSLIDEELADVDRERHASLFSTTPILRRQMDHLRAAMQTAGQSARDCADSRPREVPELNTGVPVGKPHDVVLIRRLYEEHCAVCSAAGVSAPTPEGWVDLIEDMLR